MKLKFCPQLAIAALITLTVGCAPEPNRQSTQIESAGDVKISVGDPVELPAESKVEPEASESPAAETVASAAPSSKPATAPTPSKAPTEDKKMTSAPVETAKPDTVASSSYSGPAKFQGRVVVTGAVPNLAPLLAQGAQTKDPFCAETAVPNESVVVSADGGLANVFVYLKKAPRSGIPAYDGGEFVVDQKGCVFLPHAQVIRVGAPLVLKNSDPVAHNVRLNGLQTQFNETVGAGAAEGLVKQVDFAERLPAGMVCDFHNWMSGYVLPVDHPWATVTDAEGRFEIPNLPDGTWEFVLWHEKALYIERSFKVTAAPNKLVENVFEVNASKLSQ